jgi:hypothetical protein
MLSFFYVVIALAIIMSLFVVFQAIGGKIFGGDVEEIGIFIGPKIYKFRIGKLNFRVNLFPTGCYVRFTEEFEKLLPIRKLAIVITGLVSYLVVALVCLGFNETVHQILTSFGQLTAGVFSPLSVAVKYVEALANILVQQSFNKGLGILACKHFGFNIIPFGGLAGGSILIYFCEILGVKSDSVKEKFQLCSFFILLPVLIMWVLAVFVFTLRTIGIF